MPDCCAPPCSRYELLTHCIPPEVILKELANELLASQ